MRETRTLIVFVKAPLTGTVKTRLAGAIGRQAAERFYRETTRGLLKRIGRDRRWHCRLAVTPDAFADRGRFWPPSVPRFPQGAGDLGRRMERALMAPPPGPAVLVGGDIPAITAAHVAAAFRALERCDAVLGPAVDGGYWLVGLSRRLPVRNLFAGVPWSTDRALAATLANIDRRRRIAFVDTLEDVDDAAAYRRQVGGRAAMPSGRVRAPSAAA